jgi:hypothetical protein
MSSIYGNEVNEEGFILITSLYHETDQARAMEYIECLGRNVNHPLIKQIHVLYDKSSDNPHKENPVLRYLKKQGITIKYVDKRPTFKELFNRANKLYPGMLVIVSNADIYFNETLYGVNKIDFSNSILALTRWNRCKDGTLQLFVGDNGKAVSTSQDTWFFRTPLRKINCADLFLGTWHCDMHIVYRMLNVGYEVYNPCLTVQCCHVHNSGVRHYKPVEERKDFGSARTPGCCLRDVGNPACRAQVRTKPQKNHIPAINAMVSILL